jgi:hypothetical protein
LLRNRSQWGAVGLGEGLGQQPTEPDVVLGHEHLPAARSRRRHHRDITGNPVVTPLTADSRHADVKVG